MIGIEREAGLLRLTLRRPDKANSLTKAMLESLVAALDDVPQALVLTGEGKVFSAGADLDEARAGRSAAPTVRGRSDPRMGARAARERTA